MAIRRGVIAVAAAVLLTAACDAADTDGPATTGPAAGSTASGPAQSRSGQGTLRITTQLGEQCPHLPVTPDPRCDPKPRPDTGFEIRSTGDDLVAEGRTGADGRASLAVEPGTYVVRGEPVTGYQFTPERRVTVSGSDAVAVPLTYTNGIQ
ncbi:hypothetical protein NCC78_12640 [Micromonospora phytophila]|uniref:hypothetical protein n=1 Tax=Micromonospora phytophila TaxID=709888 RepID=UPI002030B27A|nr:hypothetical protein [Micromonospora phytophila]MCM0675532.1 hypothetical protein [Micromonospora phytophila]